MNLKERFPRASQAFLRLNADVLPDDSGQAPKLERDSGDGALGAVQVQKRTGEHFLVRVTSIRKRLLDYDNLCEKYHVDLLRYAGIILGDCPAETQIEVRQEKAEKGEPEEVRIEVFKV